MLRYFLISNEKKTIIDEQMCRYQKTILLLSSDHKNRPYIHTANNETTVSLRIKNTGH